MQLAYFLTLLISIVVAGILVGLFSIVWLRWKEWLNHTDADLPGWRWREGSTIVSLALVLLSTLMFAGYGVHNALIGGDQGGDSNTLMLIKTGNSLSFLGAVLGLLGKGKGRLATALAGCCTLLLWFWQGMSL